MLNNLYYFQELYLVFPNFLSIIISFRFKVEKNTGYIIIGVLVGCNILSVTGLIIAIALYRCKRGQPSSADVELLEITTTDGDTKTDRKEEGAGETKTSTGNVDEVIYAEIRK